MITITLYKFRQAQLAAMITKLFGSEARGFGSLPVRVTIGVTTWDTSIFPHTSTGSHLLPLKATVRKAEHIQGGDTVAFSLELRV